MTQDELVLEDDLVNKIYEAAIIPDVWPIVLEGLSTIPDCEGGFLFVADAEQRVKYIATERYAPMMQKYVGEGWMQRCLRAARVVSLHQNGFLTDFDIATPDEIESHPYYTDFLRLNHGGWAAGTAIPTPSGELIVFNLERAHSRGPVDRMHLPNLNRLRPHLARAGLLSARLGIERVRAASEALSALGLPAAALTRNGALYLANALFENLIEVLVLNRRDRLRLLDERADGLFGSLLESNHHTDPTIVRSIPISAVADRPPYIIHLLPVAGSANDIFSPATSFLVVTPVDRAMVPNADVLQGLFDLTPAEARVAQGIGRAETVEDIAGKFGVSRETIRYQLKSVLGKTGLSRQQELVSLLAGKVYPGH